MLKKLSNTAFFQWAASASDYIRQIRGKRWYAVAAFLFSLAFSDVRSGIASKFADMSDFLIWMAHAPETLSGRCLIVLLAFVAIAIGIRQGFKHRKISQRNEYAEILDLLGRPYEVIQLSVRHSQIKYAEQNMLNIEPIIKSYESEISNLRLGGEISAYQFDDSLHTIISQITECMLYAQNIASPHCNIMEIKFPTGKKNAGKDWYPNFLPSENNEYFSQHEHNVIAFRTNLQCLVSWLKLENESIENRLNVLLTKLY